MEGRIVVLAPRFPERMPAWERRSRQVLVTQVTSEWWDGKPLNNPACPSILWLKSAWIEIPREEVPCR